MRDFRNERLTYEGREGSMTVHDASGLGLIYVEPDFDESGGMVLSRAEAEALMGSAVTRWNACADALARADSHKLGDSQQRTLEDVVAILRRAVNGEG